MTAMIKLLGIDFKLANISISSIKLSIQGLKGEVASNSFYEASMTLQKQKQYYKEAKEQPSMP